MAFIAVHLNRGIYESPYDAFTNYMNILGDFISRVKSLYPEEIDNEELNSLLTTIKNQDEEIEQKSKEIIRLQTKIEKIEVEESKLREKLDKAAGKKASDKVKEAPAKVAATKAKETKKPVATKVKAEPTVEKKPAKAKTRKAATSKAEPTKE